MSNNQTEYNILGCTVRIKSNEDNKKAVMAIDLLNNEISKLKNQNSSLKDIDLAVMSALNLASKLFETEAEYKENVFALKSSVEDSLKHVEGISTRESASERG